MLSLIAAASIAADQKASADTAYFDFGSCAGLPADWARLGRYPPVAIRSGPIRQSGAATSSAVSNWGAGRQRH
jgi:hypothetical protein